MASPLPDMEHYWGDVHQVPIIGIRDRLQSALPGDPSARMQEWVYNELPDAWREYYP
jgi:hypothetical protein